MLSILTSCHIDKSIIIWNQIKENKRAKSDKKQKEERLPQGIIPYTFVIKWGKNPEIEAR